MTRDILEDHGIMISTFWNGHEEGVQVTILDARRYVQMTRDQAIDLFNKAWDLLLRQKLHDREDPPWWQESSVKEAATR